MPLVDPRFDATPVTTFVVIGEIREGLWVVLEPHMRDESQVRFAHDGLSQHFHAVIQMDFDRERPILEFDREVLRLLVVVFVESLADEVETLSH